MMYFKTLDDVFQNKHSKHNTQKYYEAHETIFVKTQNTTLTQTQAKKLATF